MPVIPTLSSSYRRSLMKALVENAILEPEDARWNQGVKDRLAASARMAAVAFSPSTAATQSTATW